MDSDTAMPYIEYEWDDVKAAANISKHRVDFYDAIAALEDPAAVTWVDTRFGYGEERFNTLGLSHGRVLFVVTTERRDDVCRIISARKANKNEQVRYYAGET